MKEFVTNLRYKIEIKINSLESTENDSLIRINQIINCLVDSLKQLKIFIVNYEFKNQEEEILFFKELKPQIYSLLLFYVRLYKIEEKRPASNKVSEDIYISHELKQLDKTFTNSLDFYNYYRTGDTSSDYKYFVRKNYDRSLDKDPLSFEKDYMFSTSYDYEVANIIANDLLKAYLISELNIVSNAACNNLISLIANKQMKWTDSKVSLVEFVYGLHSCGSINHGNVELKDLIMCFETLFNIELGDFYRAFLEIRERKKSRTQYIERMRDALITRMDDFDK